MSDFVTLSVNGLDFSGWKSVRVEAGVERQCRSFELSVTDQWPGSLQKVRRIKPGDLCEVRIGADLVCTGYVDATPIDYDANSVSIIIRGRSKTADLVDCSADNETGQFKGMKAEVIAQKLAGQYGLNVINETDTGAVISDHQIQQGETAFESLDRLGKQRQILITDNAAGDVVLASPGSGGHAFSGLELGVNILSGSAGFDYTDVYSHYSVKGQSSKHGQDSDWTDASSSQMSQAQGSANDSSLQRRRVLVVRQAGQADANTCQQRASYEQQVRAAKAGEIRYRVAGWRQADGSLWRPNITVSIKDVVMLGTGRDLSLLISEVILTLDESGMIAELVCIPPAAFLTEPEKQAKAVKRKEGVKTPVDDSSWLDDIEIIRIK
jgi:prophage tail gpP-like protein